MTGVRPRRVAHRGSVVAAGLRMASALVSEPVARRRILDLAVQDLEVFRFEDGLVVRFARPRRIDAGSAPGEPLVRHGRLLAPCPLAADEAARLTQVSAGSTGDAVVVVTGGLASVRLLGADRREDLAAWIDLAGFGLAEVESLGRVAEARASFEAVAAPGREQLGVAAAAPEMNAVLRALVGGRDAGRSAREGAPDDDEAPVRSRALARPASAGPLARLAARVLRWLAAGRSSGATRVARALPAPDDLAPAAPPRPSLIGRLGQALRRAAARAVLRSGLSRRIGRAHARYLARMLELFESNQLDEALRHGIPLTAELGAALAPSLRAPRPRADLSIRPGASTGGSGVGVGGDLFAHLRQRYRQAFEQLVRRGEIEKAAFVLAELLRASEEAVSFLERHGRLRLAAELAEGRGLPAGLVVRQWFLAGDRGRAVRIARRGGAFADAVLRLEGSRPDDAAAMRRLWAEDLAAAGAFPAAVDALWPVVAARDIIAGWIDRAIAIGGPTGARMLGRKARLLPASFPEVLADTHALLADAEGAPEDEAGPVVLALARELATEKGGTPVTRPLARLVARRLLSGAAGAVDERLMTRVLDATGDAVLRADVPAVDRRPIPSATGFRVRAWGASLPRLDGSACEDQCVAQLVAATERPGAEVDLDADAADRILLAVLDGGQGWTSTGSAEVVTGLVAETLARELRGHDPAAAAAPDSWTRCLVGAVQAAHRRLIEGAVDPILRDLDVAATVATVAGGRLLLAQVGTTRAFLLRRGVLIELTQPHVLLLDGRPEPVVVRALGLEHAFGVDVATCALEDRDLLVLCSVGTWSALSPAALTAILAAGQEPRDAARGALAAARGTRPLADVSLVVARFDRIGDPVPGRGASREAEPLNVRTTPRLHRRAAADRGAIPVVDAAALPDGRLVVALGEAGALLLSRDGAVQARFAEPAEHLILSDHGDRVLLVARRGEVIRVARLDLVGRRLRPWCDARVDAFAADHDGATWFVARGDTVLAIDALSDGWEHLWKVDHPGFAARSVRREAGQVSVWFEGPPGQGEVWTYQAEPMVLRSRRPIPAGSGALAAAHVTADGILAAWRAAPEGAAASLLVGATWRGLGVTAASPAGPIAVGAGWAAVPVVTGDGAVVHLVDVTHAAARLRLELDGATVAPAIRIQGERLVVADRCGRVLVLSLRTGSIRREARIA